MSNLERREALLASRETNYSTDPVLSDTDAKDVLSFDLDNNDSMVNRFVRAALIDPHRTSSIGKRFWNVSVSQYVRGSSASYDASTFPQIDPFLMASGFTSSFGAATHTYSLAYDLGGSCAVKAFHDGIAKQALGVRGTSTFSFTMGMPVTMGFTGFGLFSQPTDTPLTVNSADYVNGGEPANPPIVLAAGFHPYGDAPTVLQHGHVHNITINLRMSVQEVGSMSLGTTGNGVSYFQNTGAGSMDDAGIEVVFDVEQPTTGVLNPDTEWWDRHLAREIGNSCTITVGSAAKNTFVFTLSRLSVEGVKQIRLKGMQGQRVTCRVLRSAAGTTNDSLTIAAS